MSTLANGPAPRPGRVVAKNAAKQVHAYFARHWRQMRETSRETLASLASAEPSEPSSKFVKWAVLEGDQIRMVDVRASAPTDRPTLFSSVLGCDSTPGLDDVDVLRELAVSMRAHGHGGTLLVVPGDSDRWRESLVHPMPYAVRPGFSTLATLAHEPGERRGREWEADFSDAVEVIAGLTAVDGATVITDRYELIAFGAKTAPREGHLRVEQVAVSESIEDGLSTIVHPTRLGGTRHFSAVQFVSEQRHAPASVA